MKFYNNNLVDIPAALYLGLIFQSFSYFSSKYTLVAKRNLCTNHFWNIYNIMDYTLFSTKKSNFGSFWFIKKNEKRMKWFIAVHFWFILVHFCDFKNHKDFFYFFTFFLFFSYQEYVKNMFFYVFFQKKTYFFFIRKTKGF